MTEINHAKNKKYYWLFSCYLVALSIIGLKFGSNRFGSIITLIFGIFLAILPFVKKKIPHNKLINLIFTLSENFFQKISTNHRNRIEPKTVAKRLLYLLVFIVIPISAYFLLIGGSYSSSLLGTTNIQIGATEEIYEYKTIGELDIRPTINESMQNYMSYAFDQFVSIPLLDICFLIFDSENNTNLLEESLKSNVTIFNNTYSIPYETEVCIPSQLKKQIVSYEWTTSYKFNKSSIDNQHLNHIHTISKAKINSNFWILFGLLFMAWLGTAHLIYHVIKDFNDIN